VLVTGYGTTARTRVRVHRAVQSLTIIPAASGGPVRIPMAQSRRFEVRALAADSTPVPEARVTWSVVDTSIATFDDSTGVLSAVAAGATTLTARITGFEPVSWAIEVVPARVALDRTRLAVGVGGRDSLRGGLVDERGEPIGATIPELTWTSSSPAITLSPDGEITGRSLGRAAVVATAPWGAAASATVYVTGEMLVSSNRGATTPQGFGIFQRATGSNAFTPIRSDSATSLQAVFSPDRTRIAFNSNAAGSFDLYVMDADGANAAQVTSDPGLESEPAWSRDGERIYFARSASGGSQIASVAIDGRGLQLLTSVPGGHLSPVVSPDRRTSAFVTARDGHYE